jgi:nucleotide-binding universal stress UspA family protein
MHHTETQDRPTTAGLDQAWSRVLVLSDGSDRSDQTLRRARHFLDTPGVEVTLLRVIECDEYRARDLHYRTDRRHRPAGEALAISLDGFTNRSAGGKPARAQLRFGDPVTEILAEIREAGHDLVVMDTQGRTALSRLFGGGVAERLMQESPAPLLVFSPMNGRDATTDAAPFKRLLVMLDGLEPAEEILPMAEQVAHAFGSELHLFGAVFGGSREAAKRREAESYFQELAATLARRGIASQTHVCTGRVVNEALDLIREQALDSVALMTHGRAGLAQAVHGSVADRLIRESSVPVLVLRNRHDGPAPGLPGAAHRQLWVE